MDKYTFMGILTISIASALVCMFVFFAILVMETQETKRIAFQSGYEKRNTEVNDYGWIKVD